MCRSTVLGAVGDVESVWVYCVHVHGRGGGEGAENLTSMFENTVLISVALRIACAWSDDNAQDKSVARRKCSAQPQSHVATGHDAAVAPFAP